LATKFRNTSELSRRQWLRLLTDPRGAHSVYNSRSFLFLPFGFATDVNIQNFRQANRRVATVEGCAASAVAETADQDRKKAATLPTCPTLFVGTV